MAKSTQGNSGDNGNDTSSDPGVAGDAATENQPEIQPKTPRIDIANDKVVYFGNRAYLGRRPNGPGGRMLDILPDLPDIRDRIYQPNLQRLPQQKAYRISFSVRDQGKINSCVGHALAHVIDVLRHENDEDLSPERASATML
ncbi:hypothetical protein QO002_001559 [Pararhizobium capsulatum DSM 1112]|uniref:Uncharacterized protein n=1 Tax=Pararhizobium capsulatum DSM 1112 TaxID=1121113 RepID=A0ABU0BME9_9HYPH|nr:hypothetical protein [Pararhizobium capsulatum]MDQ0319421.1 hypothetical protein [Pararhizobium capsulatum DSM 1112]